MEDTPLLSEAEFGLVNALNEVATSTREQLQATCQLHVERAEKQLLAGWSESIDRVLEKRFLDLASRAGKELEKAVASRVLEQRERLAREIGDEFNQTVRRLRRRGEDEELYAALLDAAARFCGRAIVLISDPCSSLKNGESDESQSRPIRQNPADRLNSRFLRIAGSRGLPEKATATLLGTEITVADAPALAGAIDSMDTLVTMRTSSELSERLVTVLGGEAPGAKAFLFPVVSGEKTVALLYADAGDRDVRAGPLELFTSVAGLLLGSRITESVLVTSQRRPARTIVSDWAELAPEDQRIHLRAQRFARVQVAKMRLYSSDAVESGRARRNLYAELRDEIDAGRESFRLQFVVPCSSMVDYVHLELVRTLANDDASLLGSLYPGPLV
jgi:hypothetical protein